MLCRFSLVPIRPFSSAVLCHESIITCVVIIGLDLHARKWHLEHTRAHKSPSHYSRLERRCVKYRWHPMVFLLFATSVVFGYKPLTTPATLLRVDSRLTRLSVFAVVFESLFRYHRISFHNTKPGRARIAFRARTTHKAHSSLSYWTPCIANSNTAMD